jgi:hypothetical protein
VGGWSDNKCRDRIPVVCRACREITTTTQEPTTTTPAPTTTTATPLCGHYEEVGTQGSLRWRTAEFTAAFAAPPIVSDRDQTSFERFQSTCSCACEAVDECSAVYLVDREGAFLCSLLRYTGGLVLQDNDSGTSLMRVSDAQPASLDSCATTPEVTSTTKPTTPSPPILSLYEERYGIEKNIRFSNAFHRTNVIIRKLYPPTSTSLSFALSDCAVECWNAPTCLAFHLQFETTQVFCNLLAKGSGRARSFAPAVSMRLRSAIAEQKILSYNNSTSTAATPLATPSPSTRSVFAKALSLCTAVL